MPIHPRLVMLSCLSAAALFALVLVVLAGTPVAPAVAGAAVAAGFSLLYDHHDRLPAGQAAARAGWCYVVAAGASAVLLWGATAAAAALHPALYAPLFITACLLSAVVIGLLPGRAHRQFRRIAFENSLPASER